MGRYFDRGHGAHGGLAIESEEDLSPAIDDGSLGVVEHLEVGALDGKEFLNPSPIERGEDWGEGWSEWDDLHDRAMSQGKQGSRLPRR